jgi:hypothetical protein
MLAASRVTISAAARERGIVVTSALDGPCRVISVRYKGGDAALPRPLWLGTQTRKSTRARYGVELKVALPFVSISIIAPSRQVCCVHS